MSRAEATGSTETDLALQPLRDYRAPSAPAHDLLERLGDRARRLVSRERRAAVQDDNLQRADRAELRDYIAIPDCLRLTGKLESAVQDWTRTPVRGSHIQLLVIPPCERHDLIAALADRLDLQQLQPPARTSLHQSGAVPLPDIEGRLKGDGILVIPELERWFLRHRHGLEPVRHLLRAISAGNRRCVIGVNSWAWHYLVSAAQADLLMPTPMTFPPFEADDLADWFEALATEEGTDKVTVRSAQNGDDILARDEDGKLEDDHLRELASRSRGIPWVAWQMWRRGLRTLPDKESDEQADVDDGKTLWATHDAAPLLPTGHEQAARLVLHAILIHGDLDTPELIHVLPALVDVHELVRALDRAGVITRDDESAGWYVLPSAYPAVRVALDEAGFSMAMV